MKKLLTFVVLLGLLLSLQVSLVGAQETDTPPPTTYTVVGGDTAGSIAAAFGVSVEDLLAANGLTSADEVVVGLTLIIPPVPEPTEEATQEPTVEPTEEATQEPTEEATQEPTVEPTEEATQEPTVEPTEAATEAPTAEPTQEPSPVPETSGQDVEAAGALPGSSTTGIIAIANLETAGSPEAPVLTLYDIDDADQIVVGTMPSVYPGGVGFVTDSQFTTGRYAGVIQSSFQAAAAALTVNLSAHTGDAYPGLGNDALATTLFGTLIFNKHYGWESTLFCQNAGATSAHITAQLYQAGEVSPKATISTADGGGAMLEPNETVVWDIADMSNVQAAWPGGNGKYGYAKFTSTNNIACVIQNDKLATGQYVSSQFQAVPTTYSSAELFIPVVFNGHGSSKVNKYGNKWISGLSIVNPSGSSATVNVIYSGDNGTYSHTCSATLPGGSSLTWYAPEMGTTGGAGASWTCPSGKIQWVTGTTFGSAKITASGANVLVIGNSNKYDVGGLGAIGYSGLAATSTVATKKAVCPLVFNKSPANDWVTGIPVVNIGTGPTDVTVKMVRAGTDPTNTANYKTFTQTNLGAGKSFSIYFPEQPTALTNFEGAVFVESTSQPVAVESSSTNYGSSVNAGALYDCINYE